MLTKENDVYIYFEVIKDVEPCFVIDFGMTLMKAGAVSRGLMKESVPENVNLIGVTDSTRTVLPIYKEIYDEIFDSDELTMFWNNRMRKERVLGVLILEDSEASDEELNSGICLDVLQSKEQINWLLTNQKNIADKFNKCEEIVIEEDRYFFCSK